MWQHYDTDVIGEVRPQPSHDRWFLDRVATHILAFEGDSQATWFEGNYSDYEEDYKRRHGNKELNPERIKYKKLKTA